LPRAASGHAALHPTPRHVTMPGCKSVELLGNRLAIFIFLIIIVEEEDKCCNTKRYNRKNRKNRSKWYVVEV
jgi:hypothetical protein